LTGFRGFWGGRRGIFECLYIFLCHRYT
jgi:hypothetical protein